jgi:hypothetical protein
MPLRYIPDPPNGAALVHAGLNRLAARGPTGPLKLRATDFTTLALKPPHAVYDLHADEIAQGGGLRTAHLTGVRYLVHSAGVHAAAAEVHLDADGNAALLANTNYGQFVAASALALDHLAALDVVRNGSFEARLLRFSAIALLAIWLKSDPGGADIIYPIAPAPDPLQAGRTYSEADFLKAILPLAQKRAAARGSHMVP